MALEENLKGILRANTWFLSILEAVRQVNPPDWYVGGGLIRTLVWDYLHEFQKATPLADVDVIFFDATDFSEVYEQKIEQALTDLLPSIPWQARNQAAVHTWYEKAFAYAVEPLQSTQAGIATFPETATAIGVKLEPDNSLRIFAPCGLEDLFGMILRCNPARVTEQQFLERLGKKRSRPNGLA